MSSDSGLRIALGGATGLLGREVAAVLDESGVHVASLHPFATDGAMGEGIEWKGDEEAVAAGLPSLASIDLLIVCTPRHAALDLVREALRAEVACIDCSGSLSGSAEVPLVASGLSTASTWLGAPLVAAATGPSLAWAQVLAPIAAEVGLRRVVGTLLRPVSHVGRAGIDALSEQTIGLLTHQEPEDAGPFDRTVAFDCVPGLGEGEGDDGSRAEAEIARDLGRLLPGQPGFQITAIQVPAFVGDGSALSIETERPLSPGEATELLSKATNVELWDAEGGPSTRDTAGRDHALVGRLRADPSVENGLSLWVASDSLRLTARNVVAITEMRLRVN